MPSVVEVLRPLWMDESGQLKRKIVDGVDEENKSGSDSGEDESPTETKRRVGRRAKPLPLPAAGPTTRRAVKDR